MVPPDHGDIEWPLAWVSLGRGHRQWVIFETSGESISLFRVPVSTAGKPLSSAEQIAHMPGNNMGLALSGDGRLVFSSGTATTNLWSIPIDTNQGRITGGLERAIQVEGVRYEGASLSRDGKKAVFVSDGHIRFRELETGQEKQLADGNFPSISPDGSFVVYQLWEPHKPSLYMVSSMGGAPRRICQKCGYYGPKGFSSDGSKVLAQRFLEDTQRGQIELINIASGEVKVVLSDPSHALWHPYFSWDDNWVTFKMALDPPGNGPEQHFRLYITPLVDYVPAGEGRWIR